MFISFIAILFVSLLSYAYDPIIGIGVAMGSVFLLFGYIISWLIYNCIVIGTILSIAHLYFFKYPDSHKKILENQFLSGLQFLRSNAFVSLAMSLVNTLSLIISKKLQYIGYYEYVDVLLVYLYGKQLATCPK